jgi:glycosyltransferase involved in cell wall biosynthesis
MRIALVGHGDLRIPPKDWGAVEGTIWQKKQHLEKLGHTVDIYNSRAVHDVMHSLNQQPYDFVHCHSELFALPFSAHVRHLFAITSHFGGLYRFAMNGPESNPAFDYLFEDTLKAPANFVLSPQMCQLYRRRGYMNFLRVLRNAVETSEFRVETAGNGRAVCVGRICARKRQSWLAALTRKQVRVDFVGPTSGGAAGNIEENETATYLGTWDRETLYARLTEYSCLVLLSESEGAPKVVLEALAAGLNVVVTKACTANLTDEEFITVIPDGETRPDAICEAIQTAIDRNARHRAAAVDYARRHFDYAVVMPEYIDLIEECRAFHRRDGQF